MQSPRGDQAEHDAADDQRQHLALPVAQRVLARALRGGLGVDQAGSELRVDVPAAPRNLADRPWYIAALLSWGIALFEYLFQVPANRIGHSELSLGQLKILQEVITLSVFVPFAWLYMREPVRMNYLWAALCMCGAVYFMFRK